MPSLFSELIEGVDYIEFLEMGESTKLSRALDGASSPIYIPSTVDLPFGRSIQKVAYVRYHTTLTLQGPIADIHHGVSISLWEFIWGF